MSQPSRQPWDVGRFMQTLTYFEALPVFNWFQKMLPGFVPPPLPQLQAGLIFDFRQPSANLSQTWGPLDDIVMGGISASSIQARSEAALFTGRVSTANSGGFASVRTRNFEPSLNLAGHTGVALRVKGDGQRYKFLIRDNDTWDSIAYSHSFDTVANQWIDVRVPFTALIPVFRAKTVPNAPLLNTQQVRSFQLMLSKFEYDGGLNPHFQAGEFQLWVESIGVY